MAIVLWYRSPNVGGFEPMVTDVKQWVHLARLESDYSAMQKLKGPLITWQIVGQCDPPRVNPSKYLVTYQMAAPTLNGTRGEHILEIDCSSADYPSFAPIVLFHTPVIKHPHVYSDGSRRVCLGGFPLSESLAALCIRLARFWQYDASLINHKSLASREFYDWYVANRSQLPLDRSPLPSLDEVSGGLRPKQRRSGNG